AKASQIVELPDKVYIDKEIIRYRDELGHLGRCLADLRLHHSEADKPAMKSRAARLPGDFEAAFRALTHGAPPVPVADWEVLAESAFEGGKYQIVRQALNVAEQARRVVLKHRNRDAELEDWAIAQINLGLVLAELGELEEGTSRLSEAAVVYRAALEVYTREESPDDWALVQN